MIRFTCPHCQKRLKADDTASEGRTSCPRCRESFHVKLEDAPTEATIEPSLILKGFRPSRGHWQSIRVSAIIVTWPLQCPCCGGDADSFWTLSHERYTGKRVFRVTGKSWAVPYCSRCIEHSRIAGREHAVGSGDSSLDDFVRLSVGVVGVILALTGVGLIISAIPMIVHELTTMACLSAGAAACILLVAFFVYLLWRSLKKPDLTLEEMRPEIPSGRFMSETCVSDLCTVRYHGYFHTVHEFSFLNPEYFDRFVALNRTKIVI